MKRTFSCFFFVLAAAGGLAAITLAQNPVASRGEQLLSIDQNECMRRARTALQGEGYTFLTGGTYSSIFGGKSIHTSGILCNSAPDSKTWVNIVVASIHSDMTVPGAERERLQRRMDSSGPSTAIQATWSTNAVQYRGQNVRVTFDCPPGGTKGNIWGTDYYTDDTSVCTAAVHAGLITFAKGGRVTIEMRQGAQSYAATSRYGVDSSGYGGWHGSFVFVR